MTINEADDETFALECIDLGDPVHTANDEIDRRQASDGLDSPEMTDRTEFEETDISGRCREKSGLKNTRIVGVLQKISNVGLKLAIKSLGGNGIHNRKWNQKGK